MLSYKQIERIIYGCTTCGDCEYNHIERCVCSGVGIMSCCDLREICIDCLYSDLPMSDSDLLLQNFSYFFSIDERLPF